MVISFILTTAQWDGYYFCLHFTHRKCGIERSCNLSEVLSWEVLDPGFEASFVLCVWALEVRSSSSPWPLDCFLEFARKSWLWKACIYHFQHSRHIHVAGGRKGPNPWGRNRDCSLLRSFAPCTFSADTFLSVDGTHFWLTPYHRISQVCWAKMMRVARKINARPYKIRRQ